jgi:two-component system sensor histidine kinase PilS (NtrC family)
VQTSGKTFSERTWLEWLVKVRIIVITFVLVIELALTTLTVTNVNTFVFVGVILFWYAISALHILLVRGWDNWNVQARFQVLADLACATAVVYTTGGIDTSFNSLYPLIIIVASVMLSPWWAYLAAALSFIMLGVTLEAVHFNLVPSFSTTHSDLRSLQIIILINLFAFITVAYLAVQLSNRLRQVGSELLSKSGALENLQAMHENIVNSISGGLITTDLAGRIKLVNRSGRDLLELENPEGRAIQDLFLDRLPAPEKAGQHYELRTVTPSGVERTFDLIVSPLTAEGSGTIGYVYLFDDLTMLKRLEREVRLRDRLAAVGRLAAGIAHEIRNPLSSIAGSVKLLASIAALNEDQRALVDVVTRESGRLNNIISDFLTYSREKKYQMRTVDLVLLLEDTLTLLENTPGHRVQIRRNFAVEHAYTVGDSDKLKQVFWNICNNALRAISQRQALVTADAALIATAAGGNQPSPDTVAVELFAKDRSWVLSFADTGPGISPKQMESMFEPFQSNFEGGTGLGLALVYQILQAHQAKILVRSEIGTGSEFVLMFLQADEPAAAPRLARAAEGSPARAVTAIAGVERPAEKRKPYGQHSCL